MDEMKLKVRLEAETAGYTRAIENAKNKLAELAQEGKLLKQGERDITKAIDEATKVYGENSEAVKKLKTDLVQNLKAQQDVRQEVRQANKDLREQEAAYEKMTSAINQNTSAASNNARQSDKALQSIKSSFTAIKGLIVGYAGKTLYDALIGSNAEFEQRLTSFEVLLQSAEKAETLMGNLEDFAARTPLETDDVVTATQLLLSYGLAEDEVMEKMQQLGDLSQGNAEKLNRVALAYGQMLAKGKVTGEELRQMTEAGVPLMQALADSMGVTTGELSKLIEKSEVGIPELNAAIQSMTSEGGQFFGMMEKQSQTMGGIMSTIKDNITIFARDVGEESFEQLKDELEGILQSLNQLAESNAAEGIGSAIAGAIGFVTDFVKILWDLRGALLAVGAGFVSFKLGMAIGPIITTVTTAIKALSSAETIQNVIMGQSVLVRNAKTGAITVETAATTAQTSATTAQTTATAAQTAATATQTTATAAQTGATAAQTAATTTQTAATKAATIAQALLNKTMLTSPWFWVAAAITGVVLALFELTDAYEDHLKALEDLSAEQENIQGELSSIQSELDNTKKKIEEINNSGPLSITDEAELTRLKEQNAELEKRAEILRNESEITAQQQSIEAVKAAQAHEFNMGRPAYAWMFTREFFDMGESAIKDIPYYEVLGEHVTELQSKINDELDSDKISKYNEELIEYKAAMSESREELIKIRDSIIATDEASQQSKQYIIDQIDYLNQFLFTAEELKKMKFDDLFDSAEFEKSKNQLIELTKSGQISQETLNSYTELTALMKETGITAGEIIAEIKSYTDVTSTLTEEMDGLADQMMDLESIQEQINDGHTFSYKEIEEIREKYAELEPYIKRTADGWTIEKDAIDNLSTGVRFTQDEIDALIRLHPELDGHIKETSDGLYIEKEALDEVGESAMQLKIDAAEAQVQMTLNVVAESSNRIKAFKDEILAIQDLSDAYNIVAKMGVEFGLSAAEMSSAGIFGSAQTYEDYVNNITGGGGFLALPLHPEALSREEFESLKADANAVLSAGRDAQKTYEKLEALSQELDSLAAGGVSGSDPARSSRTKKDDSAEKAEKARQERVKAYVDEIAEKTRLDERWRDTQKAYGQMDLEQEKQFLQNKLNDYQWWANEVCQLEYFTQEERDQYYKEFMETADDYALAIFEIDKKIEENRIKTLKAGYDEQERASEKLIAQREKEGNFGAVRNEYEYMKGYLKEYYEQGVFTAQEYEDKLLEINEGIVDALEGMYESQMEDSDRLIEEYDWKGQTELIREEYDNRLALLDDYHKQGLYSEKEYQDKRLEILKEARDVDNELFHEQLDESWKYVEDRDKYNDWGSDNGVDAMNRIALKIESNYADGTISYEEYIDALDKVYQYLENMVQEEADSLREKYQDELDKRIESLQEAADREKEIAEDKKEAINAAADEELAKIEELIQARERQKEDDDDNLKMQRLQYKLQYEHDEDNRRALEKEIEQLQEEIDDKEFDREMEDRKAAIQEEKELKLAQIDEVLEYETAASEQRIEAISRRYAKKMSDVNIAGEVAKNLNLSQWEELGKQMGGAMAAGLESAMNTTLNGIYSGLNILLKDRRTSSGVTNYNTTNKTVSYSTNINGPVSQNSIYENNKAMMRMQAAAEMRSEWD